MVINREDGSIDLRASTVTQALLALLVAVLGWSINSTLNNIRDDIREIKGDIAAANLDRTQLRNEMTALEIGLRGDRFTRTDWLREERNLLKRMDDLSNRIDKLEHSKK